MTYTKKDAAAPAGWTITGTGWSSTGNFVFVCSDGSITTPDINWDNYSSVTITAKVGRYGNLTGSKATLEAKVNGTSIGSVDGTGTSPAEKTYSSFTMPTGTHPIVFTCSNATGTGHGARVTAITITGVPAGGAVHPTGVELDKTTLTIIVGKSETLTATVSPSDADNKNVTWSSSEPTVATVTNGVVKALAIGSTTITAKTEDGGLTATCAVTVNPKTAPVGAIFYESFDNFDGQGGNDDQWSGTITMKNWGTNETDQSGWTTEGLVQEASECVGIRKSTATTGGTDIPSGLSTPAFGVAGKGHVQFDAESWGNDGSDFFVDIVGGGTWVAGDNLAAGNISNEGKTAKVAMAKAGKWTTFDLEFEGLTATSKLRFYAPATKRAFLDEVAVWVEPKKWDGTVVTSLDDKTVHSVADFEEMTIKLNGATIELSDEIGGLFLGNEDGSELYAVWNPAYNEYSESLLPGINCTYVMDGDEVTLSGWYSTPVEGALELVPIPETATEIYLIDYSTFIVDGEYIYISDEDEEWGAKVFAYEAPTPTTYTVTYTVTGFVEDACLVEAGYYNESMTVSGYFEEGENTIPENVRAYVSTVVVEGYVVKVKVNGEAVTLTNGQWYSDGPITDDMTIEVVFRTTATAVENIEAVKATKVVKDGQVMIIRDGKTYNVMGMQF